MKNLVIAASTLTLLLGLASGCRTSEKDVHRWANTQQGPDKIVAVLSHEKYSDELRVEAAMTLVRMKPRSGRRVGIDRLISALTDLQGDSRRMIVAGMVPELVKQLKEPPPTADQEGVRPEDPSFPYKDAAYALLTSDSKLVSDEQARASLDEALAQWAVADFAARMDDSSQAYGMGQLLQYLGADGVAGLADLIEPEAKKIGSLAGFIADLGNQETKRKASERLVKVAKEVDSEAWLQRKTPVLQKANETSGHKVEGKRFALQLARYQEEELMRVLSSLKKVGQEPAVEYLLGIATDKERSEKRRASALAAMEGHVDRKNQAHIDQLLTLAGADDTPDAVRELALRRIGELPRKQIIESLYALFDNANWKIRWVAAELALKTSEVKHLDEFMDKLASIKHMAITEPIRYGKLMGSMEGTKDFAPIADKFAASTYAAPVRLSALSYYLENGKKEQLDKVVPYENDRTRVPGCARDAADCEWRCELSEEGKHVVRDVDTVGEFVRYCVKPAMAKRVPFKKATTQASFDPKTAEKK